MALTDEQIEKALECCRTGRKRGCKATTNMPPCVINLHTDTLDYINRLKNEIAGLTGKAEVLEADKANLERTLEEVNEELKEARRETAKEILQRVVNICKNEEDFQDGKVNTQPEPLYFGIANGCAYVRGEVKELAKEYDVRVE